MYDYKHFTVAVDFDNTCVVAGETYPEFTRNVPYAVDTLKELVKLNIRIVLWTCRTGNELAVAVDWFKDNGIPLYGVCDNPDPYWVKNPTRKIYADVYVDDKGLGAPLYYQHRARQWLVDWRCVYNMIIRIYRNWEAHKNE